jgi:hypothetical protein
MAVTLTGGERQRKGGTFQYKQILTVTSSTATIDLAADVVTLSACTATAGHVQLGNGVEGQELCIVNLATSTYTVVHLTAGTATAGFAYTTAGQFSYLKYINAGWKLIANTATIGAS